MSVIFITLIIIIITIIYDYYITIVILLHKENNVKEKIIPFIKVADNNFYISNSYYDLRFKIIRILVAYNPSKKYGFKILGNSEDLLDYTLIMYDKCMKSEKLFKLKYGNIILKTNKLYNYVILFYQNKSHYILVNYNVNNNKNNKHYLTWCVTSLRNNYDAYIQFNDTISLSLYYKVEKIIIYYSKVSQRIINLIKKFESQGNLESYYFQENSEACNMKICGKLLQLNDCFYKSLYNTKYLLNVDIDEIIIPKIHNNYKSLLRWCNEKYSLSNMLIFYTKLCIKSTKLFEEKRKAPKDYYMLPKVIDKSIYSIYNCCIISVIKSACSKYIIKPEKIVAIWLHDIWSGEYNYSIIPIDIAYTRHTRHLSYGLFKVCSNYSTDILTYPYD